MNALIGFVIAISAWLIVNTILHTILSPTFFPGQTNWYTIQCTGTRIGSAPGLFSTIDQILGGLPVANPNALSTGGTPAPGTASYAAAQQQTAADQALSVLNSSCSAGNQDSCAAYNDINDSCTTTSCTVTQAAIDQLNNLCQGSQDAYVTNDPSCTALDAVNNPSSVTPSQTSLMSQTPLVSDSTGACDASAVQAGAAAGGYTLTSNQAAGLACLAQPESACGSNIQNYNWGNGSSAYGAFQVTLQQNYQAYNNNACDAAAGLPAGTPLNCNQGFSGGNSLGNSTSQLCTQAAANLSCSASAAAYMLSTQGSSAWTADSNSSKQAACISQYNL